MQRLKINLCNCSCNGKPVQYKIKEMPKIPRCVSRVESLPPLQKHDHAIILKEMAKIPICDSTIIPII